MEVENVSTLPQGYPPALTVLVDIWNDVLSKRRVAHEDVSKEGFLRSFGIVHKNDVMIEFPSPFYILLPAMPSYEKLLKEFSSMITSDGKIDRREFNKKFHKLHQIHEIVTRLNWTHEVQVDVVPENYIKQTMPAIISFFESISEIIVFDAAKYTIGSVIIKIMCCVLLMIEYKIGKKFDANEVDSMILLLAELIPTILSFLTVNFAHDIDVDDIFFNIAADCVTLYNLHKETVKLGNSEYMIPRIANVELTDYLHDIDIKFKEHIQPNVHKELLLIDTQFPYSLTTPDTSELTKLFVTGINEALIPNNMETLHTDTFATRLETIYKKRYVTSLEDSNYMLFYAVGHNEHLFDSAKLPDIFEKIKYGPYTGPSDTLSDIIHFIEVIAFNAPEIYFWSLNNMFFMHLLFNHIINVRKIDTSRDAVIRYNISAIYDQFEKIHLIADGSRRIYPKDEEINIYLRSILFTIRSHYVLDAVRGVYMGSKNELYTAWLDNPIYNAMLDLSGAFIKSLSDKRHREIRRFFLVRIMKKLVSGDDKVQEDVSDLIRQYLCSIALLSCNMNQFESWKNDEFSIAHLIGLLENKSTIDFMFFILMRGLLVSNMSLKKGTYKPIFLYPPCFRMMNVHSWGSRDTYRDTMYLHALVIPFYVFFPISSLLIGIDNNSPRKPMPIPSWWQPSVQQWSTNDIVYMKSLFCLAPRHGRSGGRSIYERKYVLRNSTGQYISDPMSKEIGGYFSKLCEMIDDKEKLTPSLERLLASQGEHIMCMLLELHLSRTGSLENIGSPGDINNETAGTTLHEWFTPPHPVAIIE